MHRAKMSPSAASLCTILSTTALIVLVMLCRARSEADAARRSSTESHGAREFPGQGIDFLFRLFGELDVSKFLGFFQSFPQLGDPASISDLGLFVEHLARVTQAGAM